MGYMEGVIYADGTGPNQKKDGAGRSDENPPPYSTTPRTAYGHQGQGQGHAFSHMLAPALPCYSRNGSVNFDRGEMHIQWTNARANMPMGAFLGTAPDVQDNLMGWGSTYGHKYSAPLPPKDDKQCKGQRCSHDPDAIKNLKEVADDDGTKQWMCFMCCANKIGYGKAAELFH